MRNKPAIAIIFSFILILSSVLRAQQSSGYKISRLPFNSGFYNDIAPVIAENGLYFCSDRRFSSVTDRTSFDGFRLFRIFYCEREDSTSWSKPKAIESERTTLFNCGPLCLSPDGKTLYFTSEIETGVPSKNRKFKNHSGIFIADLSGTELISILPFIYNNPLYDIGQPSISNDGKLLFFASDMPGGQGGSDIYYCELVNGEWSTPVNPGPGVNSGGVDNYPYIHSSGRLYFTSDRQGGLGGLDIYYTSRNNGGWDKPVMLPEPLNSISDDFAFVIQSDLQTGFLSSNRRRSDDIYEFKSTIIRMASCNTIEENSYCFEFSEENAIKYDSIPFRYEWKYGDGSGGTGRIVEHCYPGPGTYYVQLDAINLVTQEVTSNIKSYVLEIKDIEQAYINCPDTAVAGNKIRFSADNTNLPGWNITNYYWNFDDETIAIGRNVEKAYLKPGVYEVQLIVSGKLDTDVSLRQTCVSKTLTIINRP